MRVVFKSDDLAPGVAEEKRRSLFRDIYDDLYATPGVQFLDDRPFRLNFTFSQFGDVGVGKTDGTMHRLQRTALDVSRTQTPWCCLTVNRSATRLGYEAMEREVVIGPGDMTFLSSAQILSAGSAPDASRYDAITLPHACLEERFPSINDLLYRPIDTQRPAAQLMRRYLDMVGTVEGVGEDAALAAHIETTLIDLLLLVLTDRGDEAELAAARGMRAARLQSILVELRAGMSDPAFSPALIAAKLGVSIRYVQDLLTESGASFTERVVELRLRKAQGMLADRRYDARRVSEIALACGFNDISYFNRCFRRRFGASPTQYRGGGSA